jgi:hypothetical protein
MKFKVPGSVLAQISEYDPVQLEAKKLTRSSTRNTLGLVNDLFPADIVPLELQNEWAIQINRLVDINRCRCLDTNTSHAILYTTKCGWVALWHTKPGHVDHGKYVFGTSVAYKCTDKALSVFGEHGSPLLDGTRKTLESIFPHKEVKYGRITMRKHTGVFTTSDIVDLNLYGLPTFDYNSRYSSLKSNIKGSFKSTLSNVIPVWLEDTRYGVFNTIFRRIQFKESPVKSLRVAGNIDLSFKGDLKEQVKASVCSLSPNISDKMSTPYFCRETSEFVNTLTEALNGNATSDGEVRTAVMSYMSACKSLSYFISIYGEEANSDYCQRIWKAYKNFCLNWDRPVDDEYKLLVFSGIKENVPVSSLVNMIERAKRNEMVDTFNMMARFYSCLGKNAILPKPKRWRSSEFHDMVNEELYKVQNPNYLLPQDLFPEPVKVDNLTFFQPKDTHQLGQWGRAVRNCVGNSSHYAEKVRKKSEFIVLALDNGKPYFTIQLSVRDSVMSVLQIVKQSNNGLTPQESEDYTKKFSMALEIREKQLSAMAPGSVV